MIEKTFGNFNDVDDLGDQIDAQPKTPPIVGSPLPSAGMKNKTLGSVFPAKDSPSPRQFSDRQQSLKRMKALPNRSPLGPISGVGARPGPTGAAPPGGMPPGPGVPSVPGLGDRWMGELWQGLTLDGQPQGAYAEGGYAAGGSIQGDMDLYNKTISELESGGVAGYADGGMVDASQEIADKGRYGDTMLMHVNPGELEGLQSLLGPVTINPETGNPEAWAWLIPAIGMLAGAGVGAAASPKGERGKGALMGGLLGLTLGGLGAGAASGPALASGVPASTTAIPMGGGLAGASGITWGPSVGGMATPTILGGSGGMFGSGAGVGAGLSGAGASTASQFGNLAKLGSGLSSSLSGGAGGNQPLAPPPPIMAAPNRPQQQRPMTTPIDTRRQFAAGLRSLPGSGRLT